MKLVREHINEKFIENSDPIEDMGIGIANWKKKVRDFFIKEIFGSEAYTEIFMDVAKEKLDKLFVAQVPPERAADICYDDIKLYHEWQRRRRPTYGEPQDDLKANCRSWQGSGNKEDVEEIFQYLLNRHPHYDVYKLRKMASDWVGCYEEDEDLEEGCNCGRPRPRPKPRPRPGRIINEKFVEDSDPIKDMKIDVITGLKNKGVNIRFNWDSSGKEEKKFLARIRSFISMVKDLVKAGLKYEDIEISDGSSVIIKCFRIMDGNSVILFTLTEEDAKVIVDTIYRLGITRSDIDLTISKTEKYVYLYSDYRKWLKNIIKNRKKYKDIR